MMDAYSLEWLKEKASAAPIIIGVKQKQHNVEGL